MALIRQFLGIGAAIFFLGGSSLSIAQARNITETEFESILKQAREKAQDRAYRETRTYQSFLSTKPELAIETSIYEKQPYNREHYRSSSNGRVIDEWIQIGNEYYDRNEAGSWNVTKITESRNKTSPTTAMGCTEMIFDTAAYEFVGSTALDGITVGEYKAVKIQRKRASDGDDIILTDRFWVSDEGLILKSISEYRTAQRLWTRRTFDTDFNSVVDIRVPKIK